MFNKFVPSLGLPFLFSLIISIVYAQQYVALYS